MKSLKLIAVLLLTLISCEILSQERPDTIIQLKETPNGTTWDTIITANFTKQWNSRWEELKERIGEPASYFEAIDTEGKSHNQTIYHGQVLVLYFWNIWDWDSCEKHTKALNDIFDKHGYGGVMVLSFVRENMGKDEFDFLKTHPVKFPVVPNSQEFGYQYHGNVVGTPLVFVIDKQGYWREIGNDWKKYEDWVEALLH